MSITEMPSVARTFIRWSFLRAVLHRGWWLSTSLYLVVIAELSPLELVLLGTAQGMAVLICEIPAGLVADYFSRKYALVVSHLLMGFAMVTTGLVTSFPALLLTQALWGLSWTFATGADVAWLTDELDRPEDAARHLTRAAMWAQLGAAIGIASFGILGSITSLAGVMVAGGGAMLLLGLFVAARFPERGFARPEKIGLASLSDIFENSIAVAGRSRSVIVILLVTFLVNGADEVFLRLLPKGLIALGLPEEPDPLIWLSALGLVSLAAGAIALRLIEARLSGEREWKILYVASCLFGAAGILMFALAPNYLIAMIGAVMAQGIAWNVTRVVSVIRVNEEARSGERATVQSFLSQAENLGEVALGLALGLLAELLGIPPALIGASLVVLVAATCIARLRGNPS